MTDVRRHLGAVAVALTILLAGCGSSSSPADKVPALDARLAAVDSAVAAGDDARARTALAALTATVSRARDDGDLTAAEADRIDAAAAELRARLAGGPATGTTPTPTTSPGPTEPAPPPDKGSDKGHGKDHGKDHDEKPGKDHGRDR